MQVIDSFADAYQRGQAPNPCIDCNRYLKFRRLYDRAALMGCDAIATGHYARIERENGRYLLKKAVDLSKDQLCPLYAEPGQLAHTQFPLGVLHKTEVRALADRQGFFNARKPDSQDICSVPTGTMRPSSGGTRGRRTSPATLWMKPAGCWAVTKASPTIPSASGRDWGFPPTNRCI